MDYYSVWHAQRLGDVTPPRVGTHRRRAFAEHRERASQCGNRRAGMRDVDEEVDLAKRLRAFRAGGGRRDPGERNDGGEGQCSVPSGDASGRPAFATSPVCRSAARRRMARCM